MGKQSLSERKKLLLKMFESIKKTQVSETIFLISSQNGKLIQIDTKLNKKIHGILFGEFVIIEIWGKYMINLCVGIGPSDYLNEPLLWFLEEDGNGIISFKSKNEGIKTFDELKEKGEAVFV